MNYQELPNWVDVYSFLELTDIFSQKRVCKATLHASLKYLEDLLFTADVIQKLPESSWNQLYREATRVKSIKFNCTGNVSSENKIWLSKIIKKNARSLRHIEIWTDSCVPEVENILSTVEFHALTLLSIDHFNADCIINTMKNCNLAIHPPSPSADGSREPAPIRIFIEHLGILSYEVAQLLGQLVQIYPFHLRIRQLLLPKDHQWLGFPNAWMKPTIKQLMIHLAPHIELVDKMPLLALLQSTAQGQAFQLMIDNGTNVDSSDGDGWTAMHWAARDNMLGSAELLHKHNANINAVSLAGYTPMIVGAYRQNYEIVSWLIDHKASVSQVDQDGDTALLVCASKGLHFEPLVIRIFEELGADATVVNNKGQSVLTYAGFFGMSEAIRILVTRGKANPSIIDKEGHSPLILAIKRSGDSEPAKAAALELLALGADVNLTSKPQMLTALAVATSVGGIEIAQALLDKGANVNAVDNEGDSPLMVAVKMRMPVLIHMFLNHGANPNVVNIYKETPLDMALYNKENGIAIELIEAGSKLNTQDKDGDSPLMIAISTMMIDTANKILDKGPKAVDVGIVNKRGDTALILAAFKRLDDICMRILVEYGPDAAQVYEEDEQGDTAMLVAVSRGLSSVAMYMLKDLRIHPGYLNKDGRSVVSEAVHKKQWDVALVALKRINEYPDNVDAKKLLQTTGVSMLRRAIFFNCSDFALELLRNCHIGCSKIPPPRAHGISYSGYSSAFGNSGHRPVPSTTSFSSNDGILVNAAYLGMTEVVELLCKKLPPEHLEAPAIPSNYLIEKENTKHVNFPSLPQNATDLSKSLTVDGDKSFTDDGVKKPTSVNTKFLDNSKPIPPVHHHTHHVALTPLRAAISQNHSMTAIALLEAGASSTGLDAADDNSPVLKWLRTAAIEAKNAQNESLPKGGLSKISTYLSPAAPLIARKLLQLNDGASNASKWGLSAFSNSSGDAALNFGNIQSPSPVLSPTSANSLFYGEPIPSPIGKEIPDYLWNNVSKTAALFENENFQRNAPRSLPLWLIQSAKQKAINERSLPIQHDEVSMETPSMPATSPQLLAPPLSQSYNNVIFPITTTSISNSVTGPNLDQNVTQTQDIGSQQKMDNVDTPVVSIPLPPSLSIQDFLKQKEQGGKTGKTQLTTSQSGSGMASSGDTPSRQHQRLCSWGVVDGELRPRPTSLLLRSNSNLFKTRHNSQESNRTSERNSSNEEEDNKSYVTIERRLNERNPGQPESILSLRDIQSNDEHSRHSDDEQKKSEIADSEGSLNKSRVTLEDLKNEIDNLSMKLKQHDGVLTPSHSPSSIPSQSATPARMAADAALSLPHETEVNERAGQRGSFSSVSEAPAKPSSEGLLKKKREA